MKHSFDKFRSQDKGFTLVEMLFSIIIVSFLMVGALQAYLVWVEEQNYKITNQRLDTIKRAINIFVQENRFLPCPASLSDPIDGSATANSVYGTATDCTIDATGFTPGTEGFIDVDSAETDPNTLAPYLIRIGAVPIRSLGLTDEFMSDAWGRRFTYAATKVLTDEPIAGNTIVGYRYNPGAISFVDTAGNSLIDPVNTMMYIVISHGPDGRGAYDNTSGQPYLGCSGLVRADGLNCDFDANFSYTDEYSISEDGAHFDDLIRYELKEFVGLSSIKRYETIPFDCIDYTNLPSDNREGERCATIAFSGQDVYITAVQDRDDGLLMYDEEFISETDGRLVMRATLPMTLRNGLPRWEEPVHAAVYISVDGGPFNLEAETVIVDGSENLEDHGFSSLLIADADNIVEGQPYRIRIYLYSFGNDGITATRGWAGTINAQWQYGTAFLEIIELEDF